MEKILKEIEPKIVKIVHYQAETREKRGWWRKAKVHPAGWYDSKGKLIEFIIGENFIIPDDKIEGLGFLCESGKKIYKDEEGKIKVRRFGYEL